MNIQEATAYLNSLVSFGIKPGLHRIEALLEALDHPEQAYKVVHVGGTNGKGSISSYIHDALWASGITCGLYTSPHLQRINERIRIGKDLISDHDFGRLIGQVRDALVPLLEDGLEQPTLFEVITAAAFLYFKEKGVTYVVLEVGLGGLLDSTNVVTPEMTVISNVSYDHQAYCGSTLEEIARHKGGIIKEGVPIVTAAQGAPLEVLRQIANQKKAPIYVYDDVFSVVSRHTMDGAQMVTVQWKEEFSKAMLITRLLGVHQAVNIAVAATAVMLLRKKEPTIDESAMRLAFAQTYWPGRCEVIKGKKRTYILDGAHNSSGAEALAMAYLELFGTEPKTIVFSLLQDKDHKEIISQIIGKKDLVVTVPAPSPRSWDPEQLAQEMPCETISASSVEEGLEQAIHKTHQGDRILVCGSLYILGAARQWIDSYEGLN